MEKTIMQNKQPATIGVDVSKDALDAALLFTDESYAEARFKNDTKGIKKLLAWAKKYGASQCPICVEATGGYEYDLCAEGDNAGHPISIARPAQVASFRDSLGLRNKTDGVDARLIALFQWKIGDDNYWKKPSETTLAIKDKLKWRRHLVKSHTMASNCARTLRDPQMKKEAAAELSELKERIRKIDASLYEIILQDQQLTHTHELLCSIPGVGIQTAATLCAVFNDNTFAHPKQFAAYIGITPRHRQSGHCETKTRITKIGEAYLRTAIFMATLSARRFNPIIRAFADQLSLRRPDLSKKEIIVACAHKLTRIIYGVLKHNKPFDPHHECPAAS